MKFQELVKDYRTNLRLSLRQFCLELDLDPSNWSKVERGINPPPKDKTLLNQIAEILKIDEKQKNELFDAAAAERAEIPEDLASNEKLIPLLPAFFRVMRGDEHTPEEIRSLIEEVRKINSPDPFDRQ